jgi:hypothetical protein
LDGKVKIELALPAASRPMTSARHGQGDAAREVRGFGRRAKGNT